MNAQEQQFQDAIAKFEAGKFRDALLSFIGLYQKGYRQEQILHILDEACYLPNEEEMRKNYESNAAALARYPFILGMKFDAFEDLPLRLYMIDESEFYIFDRNTERFLSVYQLEDGSQPDFHSAQVDAPLLFENEVNLSHLTFLNDVVRKSEDIACDNHVYLYYDSFSELAKLLLVSEIEPLLADQKFVFLFGAENRTHPLDFKKHFGIDYAACQPRELSVNEIKRIIFSWKIASASGTSFFADIMDFHPELLTIPDCMLWFKDLYTEQLAGKTRSEAVSFLRRLPDRDPRKSGIMKLVRNHSDPMSESLRKEFNRVSAEEFLTVLESVLAEFPRPSAREWLIGFFLAYSRCHGRSFGRVIPALFLYPHDDFFYLAGAGRDRAIFYFDLVGSFPYHKAIVVIRNPVTQAGSVANVMTQVHPNARDARGELRHDPFYCMMYGSIIPKDYYFPLQHPLRESTRVVRFEDLKLNPKAAFASMAEFLNIPVTQSMFQTTWCGLTKAGVTTENAVFEGWDPAPVYKTYDQYLSVFDKYRIELLLRNLIETYGYRTKYYDGQQFSDAEIIKMMELPFFCESIKTIIPPAKKLANREAAMQFIKFAAAIKQFPFNLNGGTEQFAPLPWLRPKEELLEQPLYQ